MNKKGFGAFGFLILFALIIFMWPFVFAPMFNAAGQAAIANGATGIDAFFWNNLNLWFFLTLIIIAVTYLRFGGEQ